MPTALTQLIDDLEKHPQLLTMVACLGLLLAAWVLNWIVKRILVRGFYRLLRSTSFGQDQELNHHRVIGRLANIVPALVLSIGIELVPGRPEALVTVVQNVCSAFIVLTIALALGSALNVVNVLYSRRPSARLKPIKGYVQVSKIVIYAIAVILMIATLIDRSPLILLSGLGAMAAVLLLIFQDTLLSLVASVQISSNDIIRVGDWIEMPQLNADGDVIDIALHTVKVQNFDKTITTIPTKRFITDSFRNYRGMQEAGGRRIKRALNIDQNSVHFLSDAEREHLHRFNLLDDYLTAKEQELADWNRKLEKRGQEPVNTRRVTNLGTFRAYVERYLRAHPGVHQGMTLLVRQMPLSSEGLPVEIYCFTNTTVWAQYEGIQGDIFDHLLSILPEFGLHVFQHPSGRDFRMRLEPTEAMTSLGEPGTPAP
ncbi:mechanosensitive ion channel family protein [Pseudomonas oryzihabitans]|uniref:mechanosensitive ion channel family protein n=1 Tax=Pseudomonas oryzihabitans TaxID=47885 RepID=UPI0018D61779|nr:mechanosensitive ion channel family protein [Pseudomonas oryzihabitans]MBH3330305.1 mechanosensitive ion channel family protein [Pseudomonas oryzihabitans]